MGDRIPVNAGAPGTYGWAAIHDDELTGAWTLALSATEPELPPADDWPEFSFPIDGRRFDHARVDQRVELGAGERQAILRVAPLLRTAEDPNKSEVGIPLAAIEPEARGRLLELFDTLKGALVES